MVLLVLISKGAYFSAERSCSFTATVDWTGIWVCNFGEFTEATSVPNSLFFSYSILKKK